MQKYIVVKQRTIETIEFYESEAEHPNAAGRVVGKKVAEVVVSNRSTVNSGCMEIEKADETWMFRFARRLGFNGSKEQIKKE